MIENPKPHRALLDLMSKNNTAKFGKDVTKLLYEGKTPYVAHERILVYGDPPFTATDKVGLIDIDVGTSVNLEERGIICANSASMQTDYYSEKGKLTEKNLGIENYRRSLMAVPMNGLGRAFDFVARCFPVLDVWIEDGAYDIYRGTILEENHKMQEKALEKLLNKSTLLKLRKASETYRTLFESVAAER
jgi:hypothetical protein